MDIRLDHFEVWFISGSQPLYGEAVLRQVEQNAQVIAQALGANPAIPVQVLPKPVVTSPDAILRVCQEANTAPACVGIIAWMHTFSPAKMWIAGLRALQKPFLHLHTQFNRDIPWPTIDMDFMNLNQSAHGDREFGFLCARMRRARKVVVGHWQDKEVAGEIGAWARAACAWHDGQHARIARFGDNMREVAVTEGDKVEAQLKFGWSVNTHGVGDLALLVNAVTDVEVDQLLGEYEERYRVGEELRKGGAIHANLRDAARIEIGLRAFLKAGNFHGFTTTFEDLHGLPQLPGLAVQRLMAEGYGFGAEGDWKTAALLRAMKVMAAGLDGGTSFMEDYTYHLDPSGMQVLGAHMLEICESIAEGTTSLEVHPLSIGGKPDPARLVFNVAPGPAVNACIIDLGNRFRLLVNEVDVVAPQAPLPQLPVARALWVPRPNLKVSAAAWLLAGGAHHTGFSKALTLEHLRDFAEMAGIELLVIDAETQLPSFANEIRWNDVAYH